MTDDFSAQRVADRLEINDAIYRYCQAVDRKDCDAARSVFHPGAYDNHGIYKGDIEGLIGWVRKRHETILASMHQVTNIVIDFAGADLAVAESYCLTFQRYDTGGGSTRSDIMGGANAKADSQVDMYLRCRYVDRFERRDGRWKIAQRGTVFEHTAVVEVDPNGPKFGADWLVGKRDESDTLFEARRAAGL